jgi:uncharacterized membrane protein YkvA (DUF1232 family)
MNNNYTNGERLGRILSILTAFGYVAIPVDIIPDILPLLGQLDDAGIVIVVLAILYSTWRKKKARQKQEEQQ